MSGKRPRNIRSWSLALLTTLISSCQEDLGPAHTHSFASKQSTELASTPVLQLDLIASGNKPSLSGYVAVPLATYNSQSGFGWKTIDGMESIFRPGQRDLLFADLHRGSDNHFLIDLPNETYIITVYVGDPAWPMNGVQISAQDNKVAGPFQTNSAVSKASFKVEVTTGQLDLHFYTTARPLNGRYGGFFAVSGIEVGTPLAELTTKAQAP